jgi:tetratricopeptide (TPR) repeat protein
MAHSNSSNEYLTQEHIRRLAGSRYFERGLDYFRRGHVTEFEDFGDSVEATVVGTEEYAVTLTSTPDGLEHDCTCPLGDDEEFCKHCVAVALKWIAALAGASPAGSTRGAAKKPSALKITGEDIAADLEAVDKVTLVKLIEGWAEEIEPLKEKLVHLAARRKGPEAGLALARKTLEKALRTRRFVDYQEMPTYTAQAEAAIDTVEELLGSGQAAGVIDLCEAGLRWIAAAIENVDDSDGSMSKLMGRLSDLHLRACIAARPDPAELAAKLFHAEMNAGYGEWYCCAERYAEVLGDAGLAAYRTIAEAAWARVPVRTEQSSERAKESYSGITAIMETLARQSGDVEDLVAVLERDLSHGHHYLRIAEAYRQAGLRDKALAWAERGMKATTGYDGAALRQFVAEEYRHDNRHADALRIIWIEFRDSPSLERYKQLEEFAIAADDWEDWRRQALALVRKKIAGGNGAKPGKQDAIIRSWRYGRQDHSLLVEIFLHERKEEDAWIEAKAGGCTEGLWLRLAVSRLKNHPADTMGVFMRLGEQAISRASGNYDDPVKLLERAAAAARDAGKSSGFQTHLEALLVKNNAKRNLQKRAAERRKFLYLSGEAE